MNPLLIRDVLDWIDGGRSGSGGSTREEAE